MTEVIRKTKVTRQYIKETWQEPEHWIVTEEEYEEAPEPECGVVCTVVKVGLALAILGAISS